MVSHHVAHRLVGHSTSQFAGMMASCVGQKVFRFTIRHSRGSIDQSWLLFLAAGNEAAESAAAILAAEDPNPLDRWRWIVDSDGVYSISNAYYCEIVVPPRDVTAHALELERNNHNFKVTILPKDPQRDSSVLRDFYLLCPRSWCEESVFSSKIKMFDGMAGDSSFSY
ncbi:hypothetical protein A2U01_0001891 [Trifolium medium]|uniref:Uncharacterized protein n=1 Tax=Trifolium medium TaxID=97028 RepID=A0A392M1F9_9FABA|nr:hypothetical protein [Trifolium medium]